MDNTSAVAAVRKMGSSKNQEMNKISGELWTWAESRKIMLIPNHLPGKLNWEADLLSRVIPDCWDWKLNPQIFKEINFKLGPLSGDLFANIWNAQLKNFYSLKAQPTAKKQTH